MNNQQQLLPVGSVIGNYRVVRHIASGGFGNTYEVEHVKLLRHHCVKEFFMRGINQRVGDTVTVSVEENRATFEQMRTKFMKEAQRMAQFRNPHVVPVTDFFEQNGTVYYVMDLIEGESLSAAMKAQERPFTEAEVREMLPQVLDALRGIHEKGIYHLDLKPANIMRDGDGHLWLIDFGASKQLSATESQTLSTSTGLCYTPGYAPSELVQGAMKYIGPWTDFYSLGATLYNLLTQQKPPEIADVKYDGERAFSFPSSVSPAMQQFIRRLMQPDYPERPKNIGEVEQLMAAQLPTDAVETTAEQADTEVTIPNEQPTVKHDEGIETVKHEGIKAVKGDVSVATVKKEEEQSRETSDSEQPVPPKPNSENKQRYPFALITLLIVVICLGIFFAINSVKVSSKSESASEAASIEDSCPDSNHPHAIDLGLPSGTIWACCNVGASAPEEYGDYFAWGETSPKSVYDWDTYQYGSSADNVEDIGSDIAGTKYDAATENWGNSWKMPSKEQCQELIDNCTSEWTTQNGVEGRQFVGPNGNSIFLPAAGGRWSSELRKAGSCGYYWSSTLYESNSYDAYSLYFNSRFVYTYNYYRYGGLSVRPVRYGTDAGRQSTPRTGNTDGTPAGERPSTDNNQRRSGGLGGAVDDFQDQIQKNIIDQSNK